MSIHSILVPLDGEADNQAILENAIVLARGFDAHVDVIHVRPDPRDSIPAFGEGLSGDMLADLVEKADIDSTAAAQRLRDSFETYCTEQSITVLEGPGAVEGDISACWHEETGREDDVVSRWGRLSDVVVMAHAPKDASPMRSLTIEAAIFDTGRPLLLLPQSPEVKSFGNRVGIAWDGSIPASRAVRAAMRMVSRAQDVHIITCLSECENHLSAHELSVYLSRWGVASTLHEIPPVPDGVGDAILAKGKDLGVDLMISGAFGHSKLMETIMGGVTASFLDKAKVPVLFSH